MNTISSPSSAPPRAASAELACRPLGDLASIFRPVLRWIAWPAPQPHFAPCREVLASWLNQVEIYFSIIQRKVLTPNDFADLEAIRLRLAFYEALSNQSPTPFQWKFDRTKLATLLAKIEARRMALADAQYPCLEEAA